MSLADSAIDHLLSGESLNIVGVSGSGRSGSLAAIHERLNPDLWNARLTTATELATMDRRAIQALLAGLSATDRVPALLVDDFGDYLMTKDGGWTERLLFAWVHGQQAEADYGPRCVVVTYPRDREVIGPGSALRERCRHLVASDGSPLGAPRALPTWIGQLDYQHQQRLLSVLTRQVPPRWQDDGSDLVLAPLVTRTSVAGVERCVLADGVNAEEALSLIIGVPWPSLDWRCSARRFAARCGNEPQPLWVDNYLSDPALDVDRFVLFCRELFSSAPSITRLRVLSRNWVGGQRVTPSDISARLTQRWFDSGLAGKVEWRLYDQRDDTNLHRREVVLPRRGSSFSLPTADIMLGIRPAGNETDSPTHLTAGRATLDAWGRGDRVDLA